jgi:hypothetical protein
MTYLTSASIYDGVPFDFSVLKVPRLIGMSEILKVYIKGKLGFRLGG